MTLLSAERAIPRLCDKQEKEIVTEELWVLQGWSLPLGAWKLLNLTCGLSFCWFEAGLFPGVASVGTLELRPTWSL